MTGGRLKRVASYIAGRAAFCFTYGDGVTDSTSPLVDRVPPQPRQARDGHGGAAARPLRRAASADGAAGHGFTEKPRGDGGLINGGFFVLSPRCLDLHRRRRTQLGGLAARPARRRWAR